MGACLTNNNNNNSNKRETFGGKTPLLETNRPNGEAFEDRKSTAIDNLAFKIDSVDKKIDFIYMNLKTPSKGASKKPESEVESEDEARFRRRSKTDSYVFQTNVNIKILNKEMDKENRVNLKREHLRSQDELDFRKEDGEWPRKRRFSGDENGFFNDELEMFPNPHQLSQHRFSCSTNNNRNNNDGLANTINKNRTRFEASNGTRDLEDFFNEGLNCEFVEHDGTTQRRWQRGNDLNDMETSFNNHEGNNCKINEVLAWYYVNDDDDEFKADVAHREEETDDDLIRSKFSNMKERKIDNGDDEKGEIKLIKGKSISQRVVKTIRRADNPDGVKFAYENNSGCDEHLNKSNELGIKRELEDEEKRLLEDSRTLAEFGKYESFYDNLDKIITIQIRRETVNSSLTSEYKTITLDNILNSSNSSIAIDLDHKSLQIRESSFDVEQLKSNPTIDNNKENSEMEVEAAVSPPPSNNSSSSNTQDNSGNSPNEKLKLQSIVEAVGFLMFPSSTYAYLAFKELLIENQIFDIFRKQFKTEYSSLYSGDNDPRKKFHPPSEEIIVNSLVGIMQISNHSERQVEKAMEGLQKRLGYIYFKYLFNDYEKALRSIGSDMYKFYNNLNSLQESLINHPEFGPRFLYLHEKFTGYAPSFYCLPSTEQFPLAKSLWKPFADYDQETSMDIYAIQETASSFMYNFIEGVIESTANFLWNLKVDVEKMGMNGLQVRESSKKVTVKTSPCVMAYQVKLATSARSKHQRFHFNEELSSDPKDLCINLDFMRAIFPFSILFDRNMEIKHIGDGLVRYVGPPINVGYGTGFLTYFTIVSPKLNEYSFTTILINQNMSFKLRTNTIDACKSSQFKDMELKGSISYLPEVDCLIFIGSPIISRLEELTKREMYISDIPIHDATRDIILVGEQTKAQEGLKFRMEKLKKSIVQAHEDFEQEKQKNIEILNLIFPSEIAKKLWRGEKVVARTIENVTLLYSDIVGFTSICSVSQPIEIIAMLKRLYTEFDNYCGLLDIYKIETIGDAYIVAGGLHKPSEFHSLQIAWMSLLMMETSAKNYTPNGTEIKIRVGLHSGEVLAGIVGFKQPRYCLFGNNCAVANKFESLSEEKKIHVSPVTKRFMERFDGFEFERRSNQFLPENWIKKEADETSWFLLSYKNRNVSETEGCMAHVKAGLQQYKLNF